MADEFELDEGESEESKSEKRIKTLSEKVRLTSQERDEKDQLLSKEQAEKTAALKEVEFYKSFNTISPKYQGATEFQDKIKDKVMSGYDMEDAVISTLSKEGKYNPAPIEAPETDSPAGGSAVTNVRSDKKELHELTHDEKRAKLMENEGELINILSPKSRI